MRLVIDTSVLVAALRSPAGSSGELVERGLRAHFDWLLSVALLLEYESVLRRPHQLEATGMTEKAVESFWDGILLGGARILVSTLPPLLLPDPGDAHIVALAVSGAADFIVTHNVRHF